jgi:nucleoside-diphosphate-sugar epimerase
MITGDIRNRQQAASALKHEEFDVVVDWVAYEPTHVEFAVELFHGRIRQYVFISSASTYQKPPAHYVITESTPLDNPFWQYARDKIACEERLERAFCEEGFPATIVRPSLTYGDSRIPSAIGGHDYTIIDRMRRGKNILVHGDGQSLWVVTHNTDFAKGLIGLLGNPAAIGERYHITTDEVFTWDRIYRTIGHVAGIEVDLIHVPSDFINLFDPVIGAGLLGDKAYSLVFDNSKIKQAVPDFRASITLAEGVKSSLEWFAEDKRRQIINPRVNQTIDRIIESYQSAWP